MSDFVRTNQSRYSYGILYVSKEDIAHLLCGGVITCTTNDGEAAVNIALEDEDNFNTGANFEIGAAIRR